MHSVALLLQKRLDSVLCMMGQPVTGPIATLCPINLDGRIQNYTFNSTGGPGQSQDSVTCMWYLNEKLHCSSIASMDGMTQTVVVIVKQSG